MCVGACVRVRVSAHHECGKGGLAACGVHHQRLCTLSLTRHEAGPCLCLGVDARWVPHVRSGWVHDREQPPPSINIRLVRVITTHCMCEHHGTAEVVGVWALTRMLFKKESTLTRVCMYADGYVCESEYSE